MMKRMVLLALFAAAFLPGCVYDVPLTSENKIAIDPSVLGLWEEVPENENSSLELDQMLILKFSDTEYLVHYPVGEHGFYFRAYPVKIGGITCVQLQIINFPSAMPGEDDDLFHVVSYSLTPDRLQIRTLNEKLVDDESKTQDDLVQAFLGHEGNEDLFTNPGTFRKVDG